jgi:putative ABC transport system substrate-binding protein
MRRREFIALVGGGAAFPLLARAQSSGKIWRIGFIAHRHEKFYDPLFQGLKELGYNEGQNLVVERRSLRRRWFD